MSLHTLFSSYRTRMQRAVLAHGAAQVSVWMTLAAMAVALLVALGVALFAGKGAGNAALAAGLLVTLIVTPLAAWPMLHLVADLEARRAQLDVLATRDELTGVMNRRHFLVLADREWARCRRYEMPAALLMVDVDLFKRINDENGHLAGDLMLREIARAVGDTLRQPDLLGRFGGEELIVFLPHADTLGALDAAERIRDRVARLALEWKGLTMRATVSVGVAALDLEHDSLGALIHEADQALYAAKGAGRNCVRTLPVSARRSGAPFRVSTR